MASLGTLTLSLIAKTGGFSGPLDKASKQSQRQFKQMERDAKAAAKGIGVVAAAASAAAAGLYLYTKAGMDTIDANAKMARSLDTNIGTLRGITLAASDAGVEQGKLNSALLSYNKRLGDAVRGTGEAQKAYKALGIDAAALVKLPLSEQLAKISEEINKLDTAAERTSIADSLMSNGRNVVKLFEAGGDAIKGAVTEAEALGLAISDIDAAQVESANDSISRLGIVSEVAQQEIAVRLAPALGDMADALVEVAKAFQAGEYDRQLEVLADVAKVAAVAGAAYGTYRSAIALATIAQYAFNVALRANPIGLLVTVLGAAVGALITFTDRTSEVEKAAEAAAAKVDKMTGSIESLTAAQLENKKTELAASLVSTRVEAVKTAQELQTVSELVEQSGQLNEFGGALPVATSEDLARGRDLTATYREQNAELDALGDGLKRLDEQARLVGNRPTGGGGGGGGGGGSSKASKKQEDAVNQVLQSLDLQVKMLGKTSEEQELYKLATEGATKAQLAQASAAQDTIAEFQAKQEAMDDYRALVEGLRTPEEQINDTLKERLAVLDAVAISQEEYNEAAKRAISGAVGDAPGFGGLDASIGGAFGELAKIDEAQEQLQEWYDTQLEMLAEFREQRADLTAEWDEQELALKQQHEDELARIENARQIAQLAAAESVFGDLADITRQFAGEQSGIYQAMFAVQKAAAIAQSIVAIQQGIAMAAANPWPANLAAMASVAAATAGIVSNIASIAMPSGQAHDGIDSVPADGTWNLQKGERVVTSQTSAKLDRTLDEVRRGRSSDSGGNVTVNLIEDKRRAGQTQEREGADGQRDVDVFVADIMGDGPRSSAIRNKFGLQPQGR